MVFQTTFDYPSGTVLFVLFGFAFFQPVFQIMDADAAFFKTGVAEQIAVQRGIGFDAGHGKLGEGEPEGSPERDGATQPNFGQAGTYGKDPDAGSRD